MSNRRSPTPQPGNGTGDEHATYERWAAREYAPDGRIWREWAGMRTERTAGQNLIGPGRAALRTTPVRDWFRWLWTTLTHWAQAVGILVALAALELAAGWFGGLLDPNWGPVAGVGALVVVLGFLIRDPP